MQFLLRRRKLKFSLTGVRRYLTAYADLPIQTVNDEDVAGRGKYSDLTADRFGKEVTLEEGSIWLIYKHAELALRKWVSPQLSNRVLDWGCGAGKSTLWLESLNLFSDIEGADLNEPMINLCRNTNPQGKYILASGGKLSIEYGLRYDVVLSISVLIEIPTMSIMRDYAAEAFRVLKPGGLVVMTSATEDSHDPENKYVSFSYLPTNPEKDPRNKHLKSGDTVEVQTRQGLTIKDVYWSRKDYEYAFTSCGFQVLEVTRTWGDKSDPFEWDCEVRVPSDYVIVLRKPLESSL